MLADILGYKRAGERLYETFGILVYFEINQLL